MFLTLIRTLTTLLSLAIFAGAAYLVWSWFDGEVVRDASGALVREREDWRLWAGLGLLAWSFLGRFIVTPLLGRPDRNEKERLHLKRSNGSRIQGNSGAELYVEDHGSVDAPVVVFTHGWGLDSTVWDYAKRELSPRYRVVVWDLPGLGLSKAKEVSLEAFAHDLRSVITWAGDRPVVLVGHSIGGMTIQTLARLDPNLLDNVAGVVLLNTTYTRPQETMILSGFFKAIRWPVVEPLLRLTAWLEPLAWLIGWQSYLSGSAHLANRIGCSGTVTRSQLEGVTLVQTRNRPAINAKGNLDMMRWDGRAGAAALTPPTLVIGGEVDIVTRLEASQTIARLAPRASLAEVSRANHLGPIDKPEIYTSKIEAFMAQVHTAGDEFEDSMPRARRHEPGELRPPLAGP